MAAPACLDGDSDRSTQAPGSVAAVWGKQQIGPGPDAAPFGKVQRMDRGQFGALRAGEGCWLTLKSDRFRATTALGSCR